MYIPKVNEFTDRTEIVDFLRRFSFATIVSSNEGIPVATHLPFMIVDDGGELVLQSHFARANPHWQNIREGKVLVIFSEPHAYISTSHYDQERNVPTWNYVSVHLYGRAELLMESTDAMKVLEETINTYDPAFLAQWEAFPKDYKEKMLKGIVAFKVIVEDVQAKKKLSQNRSESEKVRIINSLGTSGDGAARLVAEYMTSQQLDPK